MVGGGSIEVWTKKVDKRVDQKWTQVLDDEDCSPGNLWAQILHIHCTLISKPCRVDGCIPQVGDYTAIAAFRDPEPVNRQL